MPSQVDLQAGLEYSIHDVEVVEGELKTQNDGDEIQRPVVTDRSGGKFSIYVELVTCVHGQLAPDDATPASLIIFQYIIHCRELKYVVNAITTQFEFGPNHPKTPTVQAYSPYIRRRYSSTSGSVTKTKGIEGALGGEFGAKGDLKVSAQQEESHEQQYFEKVESGRHFHSDDRRHHQVWWKLSQNQSQKTGVTPAFRTAILLRRGDDSRFSATFNINLDGGFWYATGKLCNKVFGRIAHDELDDPIVFDPKIKPMGLGAIDPLHLGQYAKEAMLDNGLAPIWGVDVGE